MRISVVIPVWNRQELVQRAIQSVLAQETRVEQILVIDDGSTDATADSVARYPTVELIRKSHSGVSDTRNVGIQLAREEWIAFLDADDVWLPEKISKVKKHLDESKNPALLIHSDEIWLQNYRQIYPQKKHQKQGGDIYLQCLALCCISPSAAVVHRQIFNEIGLFNPSLPVCEDYDMWLRICNQFRVDFLNEALLIKYGGHPDQLSKRYWGMDRFRIKALHSMLQNPRLKSWYREATVSMLKTKIMIYLKGAMRRGKSDEVNYYQTLLNQY